jgi:hypothetical protein
MRVPPDSVADWDPAKTEEMARYIECLAATEAARRGAVAFAGDDEEGPEEPVIAIDFIEVMGRP